ncbi:MAG: GAF domain-containing protein [Anaeromyxobacter sp.]|nr:GAF domain-containing protein [Anaeromyxobacter sp.]MBL0274603.1 GAF domain-containing protein [Anaeromyxobacter sp.]
MALVQLERLGRLQELTAALSAAVTPEEVARAIFLEGLGAVGAQAGTIYWENEPGVLELVHATGLDQAELAALRELQRRQPLPAAEAWRDGVPVWLEDQAAMIARYPGLEAGIRQIGDQAWVGLPLAVSRPRGALGLRFSAPRAFDRDERAFVVAVSRLCAQALERASLFATQQAQARRIGALQETTAALSAALVPREVAAVVFRSLLGLGATSGALFLASADGQHLELLFGHGLDPALEATLARRSLEVASPSTDAARRARPIWLETPEAFAVAYPELESHRARRGDGAVVAVPLVAQGRTLGCLSFAFAQGTRLASEDRLLAMALAQQTAQALERARLFEAQDRLNRRMASMHAAAAALSGAVTSGDVAAAAARALEVIGASVVELHALDGAERVRRVASSGHACGGGPEVTAPLSVDAHHPVAEVARTGKALWLEDGQAFDARWPLLTEQRRLAGIGACALVPLLVGGRTLGVLLVAFAQARPLPAEDRGYVRLVALPCAAALERAGWRDPPPPRPALTVS